MRTKTAFAVTVFFIVGALVGEQTGQKLERDRIQATCEDDNAHTFINGVQYECMSPRLAKSMQNMIQQLINAANARQNRGA